MHRGPGNAVTPKKSWLSLFVKMAMPRFSSGTKQVLVTKPSAPLYVRIPVCPPISPQKTPSRSHKMSWQKMVFTARYDRIHISRNGE